MRDKPESLLIRFSGVMRILSSFALIGVLLAVACSKKSDSGPTGPAGPPPPQFDFAAVTQMIDGALPIDRVDSAALIVLKDGHVVYEQGFGSMTPTTVVRIASAAKWLTATTALTAVDDGTITMGRSVYLQNFLPKEFGTGKGGGDGKTLINMRQLLSLTSGIITHHPCIYRTSKTLQDCTLDIGSVALVAGPGQAFNYSQATFTVAGAAVEGATGMLWDEFFEERIRGPLGMSQTRYLGAENENPQLGDGAESTVRDYAKMLQMILDGGVYKGRRVLSQGMIDEMLKEQVGSKAIVHTPRGHARYGLGVWRDIVAEDGRPLVVSGPGSTGFIPWIDFERNLVAVLALPPWLTDESWALYLEVFRLIREIVPPDA